MSLSQLPPNELIRMRKKGWVFQTPFRYGLTPSVSQVKAYLDYYRGMSASRVHARDSIFQSFAVITVYFLSFFPFPLLMWIDGTLATQTFTISNQL